jgi:hypothetical protein
MQRLAIVAAAVALSVLVSADQQPSQPFTMSSDLVVVPTVVVDRKGVLIRGLDVAAFQVFEDGKPVPLTTRRDSRSRPAAAHG